MPFKHTECRPDSFNQTPFLNNQQSIDVGLALPHMQHWTIRSKTTMCEAKLACMSSPMTQPNTWLINPPSTLRF